jgi:hypothetical protein
MGVASDCLFDFIYVISGAGHNNPAFLWSLGTSATCVCVEFRGIPAGIYIAEVMDKPSEPNPVEKFFEEWRKQICPLCEFPLELQQREPLLWLCPMCRKWFDGELKKE